LTTFSPPCIPSVKGIANGIWKTQAEAKAASPPKQMTKRDLAKPVSVDPELYSNIGRYAGAVVLTVFEQIGGVQRMAEWADENPDAFFTKSFSKIITAPKQVEHTGVVRIEDAIKALDAQEGRDYIQVTQDAEFTPLAASDHDPYDPSQF
jgi:hypothetical protein